MIASSQEIGDMISAVQTHAETAVTTMDGGMHSLEEGLQLAAAAASDKREIQEIQSHLFAKIDELAVAAHANGERVEAMGQSAERVDGAISDASRSARMTSVSVQPLHRLMCRFKVAG